MYQNCYFVLLYNAQNTYEWFISVGEIFVAHANLYRFSMKHTKYGFFDRSIYVLDIKTAIKVSVWYLTANSILSTKLTPLFTQLELLLDDM